MDVSDRAELQRPVHHVGVAVTRENHDSGPCGRGCHLPDHLDTVTVGEVAIEQADVRLPATHDLDNSRSAIHDRADRESPRRQHGLEDVKKDGMVITQDKFRSTGTSRRWSTIGSSHSARPAGNVTTHGQAARLNVEHVGASAALTSRFLTEIKRRRAGTTTAQAGSVIDHFDNHVASLNHANSDIPVRAVDAARTEQWPTHTRPSAAFDLCCDRPRLN